MENLVYVLCSFDRDRDACTGKRYAHLYARDPIGGWGMHHQKPHLYKKVDYDALPALHRYLKAEYDANLEPLSPPKASTWDVIFPVVDLIFLPDDELKKRPLSEFVAIADDFLLATSSLPPQK